MQWYRVPGVVTDSLSAALDMGALAWLVVAVVLLTLQCNASAMRGSVACTSYSGGLWQQWHSEGDPGHASSFLWGQPKYMKFAYPGIQLPLENQISVTKKFNLKFN